MMKKVKTFICNPNCSETVMRVKTANLNDGELRAIVKAMRPYIEEGCDIYFETVFNISILVFDGHHMCGIADTYEEGLKTLPFYDKLDYEAGIGGWPAFGPAGALGKDEKEENGENIHLSES